jgi:hypothetical protein
MNGVTIAGMLSILEAAAARHPEREEHLISRKPRVGRHRLRQGRSDLVGLNHNPQTKPPDSPKDQTKKGSR